MIESKTYLVEELFQNIPEDPDNVLFTIPPEVCEQMGWKPGDNLHIEAGQGSIVIKKA
jgi:hypothetical protein